ncbi:MAG TPA: hypothetical protein VNT75_14885 [Symbiobacteriaceae bacterium]|nr:hypothetical protein [Symbiobacteriaceae bacterium]
MKRPIFISMRVRILALFGAVMLAYVATFAGGWRLFFSSDIQAEVSKVSADLRRAAEAGAAVVDGDLHKELMASRDSSVREHLSKQLLAATASYTWIDGLYTYTAGADSGQIRWGIDLQDRLPVKSAQTGCAPKAAPAELGGLDSEFSPTMLRGLSEVTVEAETYKDRWGEWVSAYAPIKDKSGNLVGAVGVDICAAEVLEMENSVRRQLMVDLIATVVILGGGLILVMFRVTRPVVALAAAASRVAQGDYSDADRPAPRGRVRDELTQVWDTFAQMIAKVRTREESLRQQVTELQIVIDESKRRQEVTEITDTDFFRDLTERAEQMRSRRKTK